MQWCVSLDSNHKHWRNSTRQQKAKWNCEIRRWKLFYIVPFPSFWAVSSPASKKGQLRYCFLLVDSQLDFFLYSPCFLLFSLLVFFSMRIEAAFLWISTEMTFLWAKQKSWARMRDCSKKENGMIAPCADSIKLLLSLLANVIWEIVSTQPLLT